MKELFIIIIVMLVLWFINEHSKNHEPFENNDNSNSKKLELSLCELVDILKRLFLSNMQRDIEPSRHQLESARHQLESARQQLEPARQQLEPARQQLELARHNTVTESRNMNIAHHVEPHDVSDSLTNHSLLDDMQLPYHGHI
jgi:exonuclease VII small subunit